MRFTKTLRRLPVWQRVLLTLLLLPGLLAGGTAGAYYLRLHQSAGAVSVGELPLFPSPAKNKRYLILAPHCDDETLAVGGFIADATAKGATVSVAFLTNGDGFPAAATRELKEVRVSPSDYVRFAERRQAEAKRAAQMLGVASGNVYFLGYPDRGLRPLWETNWQTPYRSFYTGHTHSPYPVSYTPHAPYTGQSLESDLVRLMDAVKPTDVFVTHPSDDHPDHSAAATFAQVTLGDCAAGGAHPWAKAAALHYYIVHRGDWPLPQGKYPQATLAPPPGLATTDTAWRVYLLSDAAENAKNKALSRYVSQLNICRRFLTSFVRTNELFGDMATPGVPASGTVWTTVAVDGKRDNVMRYVDASADIVSVAVRHTAPNTLAVRMILRGAANPDRLRYTLQVRGTSAAPVQTVALLPEGSDNRVVSATVPLPPNAASTVWVAVEARYRATANLPMRPVDRVGYRPVLLPVLRHTGEPSAHVSASR